MPCRFAKAGVFEFFVALETTADDIVLGMTVWCAIYGCNAIYARCSIPLGAWFWGSLTHGVSLVPRSRIKLATTWQNLQNECAPSEYSDQPGHPPSLISVFAVRMKKAWDLSYPLRAQRRLWSDWADAQAGLSLCWAHSHFVGFVMRRLKSKIHQRACTENVNIKTKIPCSPFEGSHEPRMHRDFCESNNAMYIWQIVGWVL